MIICWKYENFNPVEFTIKTQLRLKFFFQLCVKLTESDNKLGDSDEAGWKQIETGTAKLMAATRKFLLYMNPFSEQTYAHKFDRIWDKILFLPLGSAQ